MTPGDFQLLRPRIRQCLLQRPRLRCLLVALSLEHARSPFGVREFSLKLPAFRAGVFQSNLGGVAVRRQATHSDWERHQSAGCIPHYEHTKPYA